MKIGEIKDLPGDLYHLTVFYALIFSSFRYFEEIFLTG